MVKEDMAILYKVFDDAAIALDCVEIEDFIMYICEEMGWDYKEIRKKYFVDKRNI